MLFYVYIYLDPTKDGEFTYPLAGLSFSHEPFYIGKGKGQRKKNLLWSASKEGFCPHHKINRVKSIIKRGFQPIILEILKTENEQEAFDAEKNFIKIVGRKAFGEGPLLNLTEGGEGMSGPRPWCSGENHWIKKRSDYLAWIQKNLAGKNNPNFGGGHKTEEGRRQIGESNKTRPKSKLPPRFGKNNSNYRHGKRVKRPPKTAEELRISMKRTGENNGHAKLTPENVRDIRTSPLTLMKLATKYSVSKQVIWSVRKRKTWKEVL